MEIVIDPKKMRDQYSQHQKETRAFVTGDTIEVPPSKKDEEENDDGSQK